MNATIVQMAVAQSQKLNITERGEL